MYNCGVCVIYVKLILPSYIVYMVGDVVYVDVVVVVDGIVIVCVDICVVNDS